MRFSLGHRLPGGFSGRVYWGRWGGSGYHSRRRPARRTSSTRLNITLTPETLRELRALDAQRQDETRRVWRVIGYSVGIFFLMGLVAVFWYVFLGLAIVVVGLIIRIHVKARSSEYTPPPWYARLRAWLRRS